MGRLGGGIGDVQVKDVLVLRQIGSLDSGRLFSDVVIFELIVKRQVARWVLKRQSELESKPAEVKAP